MRIQYLGTHTVSLQFSQPTSPAILRFYSNKNKLTLFRIALPSIVVWLVKSNPIIFNQGGVYNVNA